MPPEGTIGGVVIRENMRLMVEEFRERAQRIRSLPPATEESK